MPVNIVIVIHVWNGMTHNGFEKRCSMKITTIYCGEREREKEAR